MKKTSETQEKYSLFLNSHYFYDIYLVYVSSLDSYFSFR